METYETSNEFGTGIVKSWASLLEDSCRAQAEAISRVSIVEGHLALMPDAHFGFGAERERGVGHIFNVPRPPGLPPARYVEDLWAAVRQATSGWPPDLVIISAGFDTMAGDPLGGFTLEPEHYAELTTRLREAAAPAPVIGALEGGYIPSRLADGAAAHLAALA